MASNSSENVPPHPEDAFRKSRDLDVTSGFDSAHKQHETDSPSSGTRTPGAPPAPKRNHRTISGYRLGTLLGQGGMGRVFRAEDSNGRSVALKLLSPDLACSPEALARFKQEGLIASQINHPHCVFVHRVDEDSGTPFIAMELMSGKTLKDLVQERGPLPFAESVRLILQCIDGLIEAHALGMIHRDIKPANCYLDEDGTVKIGDFGLARSLVSDSELTQTGAFLGTPLFASPEQLLGKVIDARSDIYSLTATLYYLLAGKAPFESPHAAQVIARIASSDPPSFQSAGVEVPNALERIVMKGLARDPAKRYDTFAAMRDDLQAIVAPKPEPTSLSRRCLAWIADYFLFNAIVAVILFSFSSASELSKQPAWAKGIGSFIVLLYYFLSESLFSTSIGKAAMRSMVVDAKTGSRISFRTAFIRALAFVVITGGLILAVNLMIPDLSPIYEGMLGILAFFANLGLLYSTWRRTGKRQLLHDWISGTECRTSYGHRGSNPSVLALPAWSLPTRPTAPESNAIPSTLGRFKIHAEIDTAATDDEVRWLIGEDSQLDRIVWIACVNDKAVEYEEQQRQKSKSKQLRFIEEGDEPDYRWFAYVAPEGVPLLECVTNNVHFPWPIARSILSAISRESMAEETRDPKSVPSTNPNEPWNANRLWVDQSGRLCLADFEPRPQQTRPFQIEASWTTLVNHIALLALPPRHRLRRSKRLPTSDSAKLAPENLPPLRACKFLESLASERYQPSPSQLYASIDKVDHGPHRVTSGARFLTSAVSLGLMTPVVFIGVTLLAIPSIIHFMNQVKEVRYVKTLQAFTQEPERYEAAWKVADEGARAQWTNPEREAEIEQTRASAQKKLQDAYKHLGIFERFILSSTAQAGGSPVDPPIFGPSPTELEDTTPSEGPAKEINKTRVVAGTVTIVDYDYGDEVITEDLMKKIVASMDSSAPKKQSDDEEFPDRAFVWGILLICIVWTTASFGGLTQYFTGICFVRQDGCRLSIVRSAWRALILYLPVLVCGLLVSHFNAQGLESIWIATQFKRCLLLLPFLYLASTIPFWQRTPLDILSGTAAIPR